MCSHYDYCYKYCFAFERNIFAFFELLGIEPTDFDFVKNLCEKVEEAHATRNWSYIQPNDQLAEFRRLDTGTILRYWAKLNSPKEFLGYYREGLLRLEVKKLGEAKKAKREEEFIDAYKIFGISPTDDFSVVKNAYKDRLRQIDLQNHTNNPDKIADFEEVKCVWGELCTPKLLTNYYKQLQHIRESAESNNGCVSVFLPIGVIIDERHKDKMKHHIYLTKMTEETRKNFAQTIDLAYYAKVVNAWFSHENSHRSLGLSYDQAQNIADEHSHATLKLIIEILVPIKQFMSIKRLQFKEGHCINLKENTEIFPKDIVTITMMSKYMNNMRCGRYMLPNIYWPCDFIDWNEARKYSSKRCFTWNRNDSAVLYLRAKTLLFPAQGEPNPNKAYKLLEKIGSSLTEYFDAQYLMSLVIRQYAYYPDNESRGAKLKRYKQMLNHLSQAINSISDGYQHEFEQEARLEFDLYSCKINMLRVSSMVDEVKLQLLDSVADLQSVQEQDMYYREILIKILNLLESQNTFGNLKPSITQTIKLNLQFIKEELHKVLKQETLITDSDFLNANDLIKNELCELDACIPSSSGRSFFGSGFINNRFATLKAEIFKLIEEVNLTKSKQLTLSAD